MRILALLLLLASQAAAVVKYSFPPVTAAGTSMTAVTGSEGYWTIQSSGAPIATIQTNSAWSNALCAQIDGASSTFTSVCNTSTAAVLADGTITARISSGMSQAIMMCYRVPTGAGWTLAAPQGGYIPNSGYVLRFVTNAWYLQKSNGTTLTNLTGTPATESLGADSTIKIFFTGSTHILTQDGVMKWTFTDATYLSAGGFSIGGYGTGTGHYGSITVDDGVVVANTARNQRSPAWENNVSTSIAPSGVRGVR